MSSCTKYNVVCCNTTSFLVYVMFSNLTGNVKWTCCFIHESEFTSQNSRPQKLPKLKSNSSASCTHTSKLFDNYATDTRRRQTLGGLTLIWKIWIYTTLKIIKSKLVSVPHTYLSLHWLVLSHLVHVCWL